MPTEIPEVTQHSQPTLTLCSLSNTPAFSSKVSYSAIRKRLTRNKQNLRIKELRSYYATYLRKHDILAEFIDLLQGRIPKSVFARHYLKVESIKELVQKVNAVTATLRVVYSLNPIFLFYLFKFSNPLCHNSLHSHNKK